MNENMVYAAYLAVLARIRSGAGSGVAPAIDEFSAEINAAMALAADDTRTMGLIRAKRDVISEVRRLVA